MAHKKDTPASSTVEKPMKQLKSTSRDLREMFRNVTVSHIAEELVSCEADEESAVVRDRMKELDFDVMGIKEKDVVNGYVEQEELKTGSARQYEQTFRPSELIAESMPLIEVLPILRYTLRMFVLHGNRVSGIVTRGDLQKAPVRLLLFGLITLLEMNLLNLIRIYYPEDSWKHLVKPDRRREAKKLWARRKRRNESLELADCLNLGEKADVILGNQDIFEHLKVDSKESARSFFEDTRNLRNRLAHAQDIVTGSSWQNVIDWVKRIEEILVHCEELGSR